MDLASRHVGKVPTLLMAGGVMVALGICLRAAAARQTATPARRSRRPGTTVIHTHKAEDLSIAIDAPMIALRAGRDQTINGAVSYNL